jgi:hypothetical protein
MVLFSSIDGVHSKGIGHCLISAEATSFYRGYYFILASQRLSTAAEDSSRKHDYRGDMYNDGQ